MMIFNFIVLLALIAVALAQFPNPDRFLETYVPMRDGVNLFTTVFFPRNYEQGKKYPVIMDRSPYGYGDLEWITEIFAPFGFIGIGQDLRGTEKSEGNFTMWTNDDKDSRDLGDWIVQQEWSNGEIYTLGASADGIASLQTPKTNPSWLKGQYIVWATAKAYQTLFPFGTYKQKTTEDWLTDLDMPNPDVVYDNIKTVYENEAHTPFWSQVEISDEQFKLIQYPTAFWAGWYDLFLLGSIQGFDGYNYKTLPEYQGKSKITIDACGHCLEAGEYFNHNAVLGRTGLVIAQMLEAYGIRPVKRTNIKTITFYVMSSNDDAGNSVGNYWTSVDTWPEAKSVDYYLTPSGELSTKKSFSLTDEKLTYKHDPLNPVPTLGGGNLPESIGGTIPCGPMDQTEADSRDDILVFNTPVLDKEVYVTGSIYADLYVSSSAIDTDFMVKVSDVYPTGEVRIIVDNAIRMRWREDTLHPVDLEPNKVYNININLSNTSYVFAPGHAIRVTVASSNYPRFSVNYNNGILLKDEAYPGQPIVATNSVHFSSKHESKVILPVVHKRQIPEVHILKEVQEAYPHLTEDFINRAKPFVDNMGKKQAVKKQQKMDKMIKKSH